MASQTKSAHRASKSSRGLSFGFALSAILSCGVIAGSAWGLTSTFRAMHDAARSLSADSMMLAAPLETRLASIDGPRPELVRRSTKTARVLKPYERQLRWTEITAAANRMAQKRSQAVELAFADERRKAGKAKILAAFAEAKIAVEQEQKINGQPSLVTALVEDMPAQDTKPFDLVLAKAEADEHAALPELVPLPEARPLIETVVKDPAPAEEKPAKNRSLGKNELAYAKPERSLLGDLFNSKSNETGWLGKGTKVAIYDVSNATVYMPDGTKLRAHSGIGRMRDNPSFEHVTMRGPTPAGIYRLKMREKRFYGVEAIRMTSIDGRDPKNRTGLLTHTNLLRGQIGSHGCVAFQNYQPFLKAFKRGQVNMLVVVPELPSSRTKLAALYRKAGA